VESNFVLNIRKYLSALIFLLTAQEKTHTIQYPPRKQEQVDNCTNRSRNNEAVHKEKPACLGGSYLVYAFHVW
jgi:hypothetical protein